MFFAIESQLFRDHVLRAAGDNQRLRDCSERWEIKSLAAPNHGAADEIDIQCVAGDNFFLFGRNLACKLLAKPLDQGWNLDAQESIVIGISQVSLRKARGN